MIEAVYEPHYKHFSEYFGCTFAGFFSDEPCLSNNCSDPFHTEMGTKYVHHPWSDCISELMTVALGGDGLTLLPALWFDIGADTAKVRIAYMDAVTRLYRENFSERLGDWARAHGVGYIGHIIEDIGVHTHTGCSSGHYFRALDGQDMAGIDTVLHQNIPGMNKYISTTLCGYDTCNPRLFHYLLPKLAASHSHIQPRKKGRAMCEIYGAYGWAEGLRMMKWMTDEMLVSGINHFVPHAFSPKFPDDDCPPHFFAGGTNPEFRKFRILMQYTNRMCHLLSDGVHVASAAVLYHAQAEWSGKNFMKNDDVAKLLTDHQLDYDIVPEDYLAGAQSEDHQLVLASEKYPCLIIPYSEILPISVIKKAYELSLQGVLVIYLNDFPERSAENKIIKQFITPSDTLTIIHEEDLCSFLKRQNIGDMEVLDHNFPEQSLRFFHYCHNDGQIYMVSNLNLHETLHFRSKFSAFSGGDYLIYDAMKNEALKFSSLDGILSLTIEPYQSLVLIFPQGEIAEEVPAAESFKSVGETVLTGPYDVSVATESQYPHFTYYKRLDHLISLSGKDELPQFSGHFSYEGSFVIRKNQSNRYWLDLGDVGECVTLFVNGIKIGDAIIPPYSFDVTEVLTDSENSWRAEVTNHYGYQMRDVFSRYLLFEPSGLLGPVRIIEKAH